MVFLKIKDMITVNKEQLPLELAKYIVKKCYDDGKAINSYQLFQILYVLRDEILELRNYEIKKNPHGKGYLFPEVYDRFCIWVSVHIVPLGNSLNYSKDILPLISNKVIKIIDEMRELSYWELHKYSIEEKQQ